ncbi:MAG: DUF58 domain-containing protein [Ilumatobacter sp.]|uniref:DUF58 domain-containing protein n=1 Tax=Ilumatobacter sp. TaxID=1967498 RepID=UPI003296AB89
MSSTTPWQAGPAHLRAVVVGVVAVAGALLFRSPTLLVLATPFAIVAVWSTATRPARDPSLVGRVGPPTVREGEATTWTGQLTDAGGVDHVVGVAPLRNWLEPRPRSGVAVRDVSTVIASVAIPMRSIRWGRHDLGPIRVACVSTWGAFRWTARDVGHRVVTLPLPAVFDAAPSSHHSNGLVGLTRSARPGDGTEFAGLRPFQSGDRLRRINWRRSLRSGELHVTATYADQDTHVALFVDAQADFGDSGGIDGAASSIDTSVRAAGAIAEHFLLRGDRVSLRVFGSRVPASVAPASGRAHLRRILDALASIEPPTYRPLQRGAPRGDMVRGDALAIMLSPLVSSTALDWAISLASHGLTVAVIDTLPGDVHVSDDPSTGLAWRIRLLERRVEMRAVQRVGIPVLGWDGPGSLDPFLREVARRASAPRMARR